MKTHWLHGSGPNKELHFVREVERETDCADCAHQPVCPKAMSKRCVNHEWSSADAECRGCIHHFTRWDSRQPVPCFSCGDFLPLARLPKVDLQPGEGIDAALRLARTRVAQAAYADFQARNPGTYNSWWWKFEADVVSRRVFFRDAAQVSHELVLEVQFESGTPAAISLVWGVPEDEPAKPTQKQEVAAAALIE